MYLSRSFLGFPAMPYRASVDIARSGVQEKLRLPCRAFLEIRTVSKCLSRDTDKLGAAEPAAEDLQITGTELFSLKSSACGMEILQLPDQNH